VKERKKCYTKQNQNQSKFKSQNSRTDTKSFFGVLANIIPLEHCKQFSPAPQALPLVPVNSLKPWARKRFFEMVFLFGVLIVVLFASILGAIGEYYLEKFGNEYLDLR